MMASNVLNKRGDESQSLFQICMNTRQRLRGIPECDDALLQEEEDAAQHNEDADPVTLLWRTLRQGFPLMALYNAFNPEQPLAVPPNKITKRDQTASMKFITACIRELNFPSADMFTISELYGEDTTGFVKVTRVVNRVLDMLVQQGCIDDTTEVAAQEATGGVKKGKTRRQFIVDELVTTERTYVQHLEMLQAFKELVETRQVVSGDTIHDIFLNLNALLDFQRRFLIRVEQTYALPEELQNWGALFTLYKEAFTVYEPYIANTKKCEQIALREFDKLKETGGTPELRSMVENPTVLSSFLLKPFQRLSKYPLLLKELRDKGELPEDKRADISKGMEAASAVLERTNEAVHLEERNAATQELRERVEDWKGRRIFSNTRLTDVLFALNKAYDDGARAGHRLDSFGDLLQYGTYQVIKGGTSSGKDEEREVSQLFFPVGLKLRDSVNEV
jgi:cell division control protein 24